MRNRRTAIAWGGLACWLLLASVPAARGEETGVTRYARFRIDHGEYYGVVEGDRIRQLDGDLFGTWKRTQKTHPLSAVTLLAPSPRPTQVLALAGNYKSHLGAGDLVTTVTTTTKVTTNPKTGDSKTDSATKVETEKPGETPAKFQIPQLFFKSPSSVIATGENIVIPPGTTDVHFEGELVIVIGKRAKDVAEKDAPLHVLGVTCGNDVSARDWQKNDVQWWRAKGCDTFGPIGPYIASGLNYDNLRLQLRVNGKTMQDERTSQLIQNVPKIVSFISRHVTLQPGDLIFTGTPGKTSAIKPGDKVEVEIEGIGTLANPVVAADAPATSMNVVPGVRQLFLDDRGIETRTGAKRVVNRAVKHERNPVLRRDRPWEQMRAQVYGTAMYDPDKKLFRLWYQAIPRPSHDPPVRVGDGLRVPHTTIIAYATSRDGVTWEKPNLGQLSFEGRTDTNLLDVGRDNSEGPSVLFDPEDPNPDQRYKMVFWEHTFHAKDWDAYVKGGYAGAHPRYIYRKRGDGLWLAYSADGVRWKNHGRVAEYQSDSGQNLLWDPQQKRYVAFGRFNAGRRVARIESADGRTWSPAQIVLECDAQDGPDAQVYGVGVCRYEGLYLGMIWIYHAGAGHGIDVQLVHSRDGIGWQRTADRQVLLANGAPGSWDAGDVRTVTQPVVVGDTIYIYYCGSAGAHDVPASERNSREFALKHRSMEIGLATLRRDGWVSLDVGDDGGAVVTMPFRVPSGALHLNADAAGGEIRASLLDAAGRTLAESSPIATDQPRGRVAWKAPAPPSGTNVRLKLAARNARLFSYWYE